MAEDLSFLPDKPESTRTPPPAVDLSFLPDKPKPSLFQQIAGGVEKVGEFLAPLIAPIDMTAFAPPPVEPLELAVSHAPTILTPAERRGGEVREDGTLKGPGFLGELRRPDGKVSTELSIGVNIAGKEILIPSLVPTLTKDETDYLLKGNKPTKEIVDKAVTHAKQRVGQGLSPFKEEPELAVSHIPSTAVTGAPISEPIEAPPPVLETLRKTTEKKPILERNLLELLGIKPVGERPIFGKGLTQEQRNRAANIMGIAEETRRMGVNQGNGLPPSFIEEHFDELSKTLGMRGVPTRSEMIQLFIAAGIGQGLITAPLGTIAGLGTFLGVKETESLLTQVSKGEAPKILQGRELKEFLGPLDERQNLIVDTLEFMVPGLLGAQIMTKVKGRLSKELAKKLIDDSWDRYVEKQSKNLLEYRGKPVEPVKAEAPPVEPPPPPPIVEPPPPPEILPKIEPKPTEVAPIAPEIVPEVVRPTEKPIDLGFLPDQPKIKPEVKKPISEPLSPETIKGLEKLGYDPKQIDRLRLSPDNADQLIDTQTPAESVSISPNGEIKTLVKGIRKEEIPEIDPDKVYTVSKGGHAWNEIGKYLQERLKKGEKFDSIKEIKGKEKVEGVEHGPEAVSVEELARGGINYSVTKGKVSYMGKQVDLPLGADAVIGVMEDGTLKVRATKEGVSFKDAEKKFGPKVLEAFNKGKEATEKRIIPELEAIEEGRQALKKRTMEYQIDLKEEVALSRGLPKETYYDLPYEKWDAIRAEYLKEQRKAPEEVPAEEKILAGLPPITKAEDYWNKTSDELQAENQKRGEEADIAKEERRELIKYYQSEIDSGKLGLDKKKLYKKLVTRYKGEIKWIDGYATGNEGEVFSFYEQAWNRVVGRGVPDEEELQGELQDTILDALQTEGDVPLGQIVDQFIKDNAVEKPEVAPLPPTPTTRPPIEGKVSKEVMPVSEEGVKKKGLTNKELTLREFQIGDKVYFKEGWNKTPQTITAITDSGAIQINGVSVRDWSPMEFSKTKPVAKGPEPEFEETEITLTKAGLEREKPIKKLPEVTGFDREGWTPAWNWLGREGWRYEIDEADQFNVVAPDGVKTVLPDVSEMEYQAASVWVLNRGLREQWLGRKAEKIGLKARKEETVKGEKKGFAVDVLVGKEWSSNQIIFPTHNEANAYGQDLMGRWMAAEKYRVTPTDQTPNHNWTVGGELKPIGGPVEKVEEEPPREAAIGAITGSKVEQVERAGFEFVWGGSPDEALGPLPGAMVERLRERGIGVRPKKPEGLGVRKELAKVTPSSNVADFVIGMLNKGTLFTHNELWASANKAFGGTIAEGKYTPKDAFDAMEMGINKWIIDTKLKPSDNPEVDIINIRNEILNKIPSQAGIRTEEMEEFQQFSTPPDLAYTMNWLANIKPEDTVLEPSAGTGGLAVFAKGAGATVIVNELSPRRVGLLKQMGFDKVFKENAEQLNNVLPKDVKPTVVIMNPPFSATAGRIKGERASKNVIQHIDQALKRLEDGGRLVALLGKGWFPDPKVIQEYMKKLIDNYNVRANIELSGKGYTKYGTSYANRILVVDKTPPERKPYVAGVFEDVKDAIDDLQEVRDAREIAAERRPAEPIEQAIPAPIEVETRPERPVLPPTGGVGLGRGEGPGEGLPVEEYPRRAHGIETERGVPVPEVGRGPRGVPTGPELGRIEPTGRAGTEIARPFGQQGEPAPEGLSPSETSTVALERAKEQDYPADITDDLYENYKPQKAIVKGSQPHPGPIVESAAMASVLPPDATYRPHLPVDIVNKGLLSDVQLESVIYAGQAHQQVMPDGERMGFFIGDGTGVGKGREIAGILLDNWNQGRKKAIWLSQNSPLIEDAKRDVRGIGWDPNHIFDVSKIKLGTPIKNIQGIAFVGYDLLRSKRGAKKVEVTPPTPPPPETIPETEAIPEPEKVESRLNQLLDWFGQDYDGVIIFDESHNMGNAISIKGIRGTTKPSEKALAGIELQRLLPKARIVYVSATGATEVMNFAYAKRLGLWGRETAFADPGDFIAKVSSGGIAAMELVARDLKAMGKYSARSLSYKGVKYDRLLHPLTTQQREIYDQLAGSWQIVLENMNKALEVTGIMGTNRRGQTITLNSQAKSRLLAAFWGSHQRFFNQIITSMQLPTVIGAMEKDIEAGRSVVVQLVNTNEAATTRALARMEEEDWLEDLDLTPREQLMEFIRHSYPVNQYEQYTDDNGNLQSRIVLDSQGNPVENADAVAMREELLNRLGAIKVPENPLDAIISHFGVDKVAEVSGRTRRVVTITDEKGTHRAVERRSKSKAMADADSFMNDRKQILAFTYAGGTGRSYHADLSVKNQRPRIHYLLQPGWRADRAVQGLGRTHRTNQAQPPEYYLVTTDLNGQKRFISSIARRLDQLGALTKGQRQTGSQGLFNERDNLESKYASDALTKLIEDIAWNKIPDIGIGEFANQLGIKLLDDNGNLNVGRLPDMPQFLNRLLSMKIDMQNRVFDLFSERLDMQIAKAIQDGTLDVGLETLRAKRIDKLNEQVVYKDEKTGAETKFIQLQTTEDAMILPWDKSLGYAPGGYVQNIKSGRVWGLAKPRNMTNNRTGDISGYYSATGVHYGIHEIEADAIEDPKRYHKLTKDEAEKLWQVEYDAAPKEIKRPRYLVSGALLPIYDRLPSDNSKIVRLQVTGGERLIGRLIPDDLLDDVKARLGAEATAVKMSPQEIFDNVLYHGYSVELANGWRFVRRKIAKEGEERIEIKDMEYKQAELFKNAGLIQERIDYETRYFVPTTEKGVDVIKLMIKNNPIVKAVLQARSVDDIIANNRVQSSKTGGERAEDPRESGGILTDESGMINMELLTPGLSIVTGAKQGIASLLLPTAKSPEHLEAAEVLGGALGEMSRSAESAEVALRPARKMFAKMRVYDKSIPPMENPGIKAMSDISQGRQVEGGLGARSYVMKREQIFNDRLQKLEEVGAPLDKVRENYFEGIWKRESRLAFNQAVGEALDEGIGEGDLNDWNADQKKWVRERVDEIIKEGGGIEGDIGLAYLAQRPFKGKESFRKMKTFDDIMTGVEFGLVPVSNNPVDLDFLKLAEMDRSIMANRAIKEWKERGDIKFLRIGKEMPEGWGYIKDKYGTVYGPPEMIIKEHVDQNIYNALDNVLKNFGIKHERKPSAGRATLGYSMGGKIVTQAGTELGVMAHEIGHELDGKYDLWDKIVDKAIGLGKKGRPTITESRKARLVIQKELRALADLKWEGQAPTEYRKKYVRKKEEKIAEMVEAYVQMPERFISVAPHVSEAFDKFMKDIPELEPLRDIQSGISYKELRTKKHIGGFPIVGHWIGKRPVVEILNNYLSSSLYNNPYFGKPYRVVMAAGNLLNQFQLGMLSAFHAGFTSADVQISANAELIKDTYGFLRGNRSVGQLLKTAARVPTAVGRTSWEGSKVLKEWRNPVIDIPSDVPANQLPDDAQARIAIIAKAAELAGGGFKMEHGLRTREWESMMRNWQEDIRGKFKAILKTPVAFSEAMAIPIMDWLVPRQKAGVFSTLAWRIIEQNPDKTLEGLRPELRQAWNRVDARLGQVRYKRLFINNAAKNVIQMLFRAPGWTGGTIGEIGGAPKDAAGFIREWIQTGKAPKNIPDRVAYTIALFLTTAIGCGVLTYLFTGEDPEGIDFIAFRDGTLDENGRPSRFVPPTYVKDIHMWYHNIARYGLLGGVVKTILIKTHPLASLIGDIVKNRDYYGVKVYKEDDNWLKRRIDIGKYVIKNFKPFWIRGAEKVIERGGGLKETLKEPEKLLMPEIGIMPAPSSYTQTKAEETAGELTAQKYPQGARAPEQFEKSQLKKELGRKLGSKKPGAMGELLQSQKEGKLSGTDVVQVLKHFRRKPLERSIERLSPPELLQVWNAPATKEEKRILRPIIIKRSFTWKAPLKDKIELRKRMRELGIVTGGGETPTEISK